jgi:hypothetical protein
MTRPHTVMHMVAVAVVMAVSPFADASVTGKPTPVPLSTVVTWDTGDSHTYTAANLTLTFRPIRHGNDKTAAELIIASAKGPTIRYPFAGGISAASSQFAVGHLDPRDPSLQVILGAYSGGAHCCLQRTVFALHDGTWRALRIDAGLNTDELEFPKDVNRDGMPDFVLFDDRFAYAFGCFACSWLPPRIFTVHDGALVDDSGSRKYDATYRKDLENAKKACVGENRNKGLCAGVAADGARLGTFQPTWDWVLKHYPRGGEHWDYPEGCKVALRPNQQCPKGWSVKYESYPEALAWFLDRNGYITDIQLRWALKQGRK